MKLEIIYQADIEDYFELSNHILGLQARLISILKQEISDSYISAEEIIKLRHTMFTKEVAMF